MQMEIFSGPSLPIASQNVRETQDAYVCVLIELKI
jgi:hypothetical protein